MNEWISVKERLPEVEADILAYIGEGSFVVCWMTLPEPPKEEGENA